MEDAIGPLSNQNGTLKNNNKETASLSSKYFDSVLTVENSLGIPLSQTYY